MHSRLNYWVLSLATAAVLASFLAASSITVSQGLSGGEAPQPTPRLPDGTPNLGPVPGETGVWDVPYITNMADRIVSVGGVPVQREASTRGGRGAALAAA